MMARRIAAIFGLVVIALAAAVALGWYQAERLKGDTKNAASVGGPFILVDDSGAAVTDETYRGKWLVINFGFTFCPDVCPTTLNRFAEMLEALGTDAARVQPLFISVDPARDTPAVLKEYVAAFDSRIVGLTGTPEQIAAAARSYRAYYMRVGTGDDYTMDHTISVYLVDPEGTFDTLLPHDVSGQELAQLIRKLL